MMQRNHYFDYLRAIAIFMVVGIHCYNSENQSYIHLFIRNMLNCAVPLFLAISGFFLGNKNLGNVKSYLFFLNNQIPRVYIPMLVWSLPFVFFKLKTGHNLLNIGFNYFLGGLGVFYFITLIVQYYILLPIMSKVLKRTRMVGVFLAFVVSEISIAIVIYLRVVCGMDIPLLVYAGFFPVWLVFYMTGIYLGRFSDRVYSLILPLLILLVGMFLSQIESLYLVSHYGTGFGVKPSSFIYAFGMILVLFHSRMENKMKFFLGDSNKIIVYISEISFAIYLCHLILIDYIKFISNSWAIKWFLTLIISIMLIQLLRWTVPANYHKYLGI